MIDKGLYVAMSGAQSNFDRLARTTNNLANADTQGFRAEFLATRALNTQGPSLNTRAFASEIAPGTNFATGSVQQTGKALDVAIVGKGWLSVNGANGAEALTRGGSLKVDSEGYLTTTGGLKVIGDGGPISIGNATNVQIASDGTISGIQDGGKVALLGQLKLSNPDEKNLVRGDDGLFRTKKGGIEADPSVRLATGSLEGSNVNVIEEMTRMVELSRQFDLNVKVMQTADANSKQISSLLNLS